MIDFTSQSTSGVLVGSTIPQLLTCSSSVVHYTIGSELVGTRAGNTIGSQAIRSNHSPGGAHQLGDRAARCRSTQSERTGQRDITDWQTERRKQPFVFIRCPNLLDGERTSTSHQRIPIPKSQIPIATFRW